MPVFCARQITETRIGSLRSRAIVEVRTGIEEGFLVFIRDHQNIRWNAEQGRALVFWGNAWSDVSNTGMEYWAAEEGLNWQRPDGSIFVGSNQG